MTASQKYNDAPRAVNKPVECALTASRSYRLPLTKSDQHRVPHCSSRLF